MIPGETLANGMVVIATGMPWRSSMGDIRQSFGARDPEGSTHSGTAFLQRGTYTIHP